MREQLKARIEARIRGLEGQVSLYYQDLTRADGRLEIESRRALIPASVIKLPILVHAMERIEQGEADPMEIIPVRRVDRMPSCGALSYLHEGIQVTLRDVYTLMIIISDNTACNLLIDRFGMEGINAAMRALGLEDSRLSRKLFDSAAAARGLSNRVSMRDMGRLLEMIYRNQLPGAQEMMEILLEQQINHKIPAFIGERVPVAHKTGEDEGITLDVAIVMGARPFVLCVGANNTQVPECERAMGEIAQWILENG